MTSIDTNVNNYTISELLAILQLDEPDSQEILQSTNSLITKFQKENNPSLVLFFQNMQTKLLQYIQTQGTSTITNTDVDDSYQPDNTQTADWYKYQSLPQSDPVQTNKITDRVQKIDVYDNQHVPMKRDQLGVTNTFDTKVAQDSLNPNLENITSRFINLDSQFRQSSGGVDTSSTDYTLDLSDPLTDVLSLRLYSVQIPYTWYTINNTYGNTCFWVTNYGVSFKITVTPGNYSSSDFVTELNSAFSSAGFTYSSGTFAPVSYNANNAKLTIQLYLYTDPSGNTISTIATTDVFDITTNAYFTFFDFTGEKRCYGDSNFTCSNQSLTFNNTLGWLMGFRTPVQSIYTTGNTPIAVLDLYGPKYFILVIDDYNQNHINNGLITITEIANNLSLPSYYNPGLPVNCTNANKGNIITTQTQDFINYANTTNIISAGFNQTNVGNIIADNVNIAYRSMPPVIPDAPRTLTQAQLYTINEIMKNREKTLSYRNKAPTASDTFSLIPIKHGGLSTGDMYVEFSGSLQDNKRVYFGPVDIDRMHIKLLDDKGYTVDLNGCDWCVTLISENLYQY